MSDLEARALTRREREKDRSGPGRATKQVQIWTWKGERCHRREQTLKRIRAAMKNIEGEKEQALYAADKADQVNDYKVSNDAEWYALGLEKAKYILATTYRQIRLECH